MRLWKISAPAASQELAVFKLVILLLLLAIVADGITGGFVELFAPVANRLSRARGRKGISEGG